MKRISLEGWIAIALAAIGLCGSGAWALYGAIAQHVRDVAEIRSEESKNSAKIDAVVADLAIIKTAIVNKGLAEGN